MFSEEKRWSVAYLYLQNLQICLFKVGVFSLSGFSIFLSMEGVCGESW